MENMIRIGKISTIDYERGMASVVYPDRNNEPSPDFPFFSTIYEMPKADDMVVVILLPNSASRGFILGVPWSNVNIPLETGKGIFCKHFSDGAYVRYNANTREMEVSAEQVKIKSLTVEELTVSGNAKIPSLESAIAKTEEDTNWWEN